MRAANTERIYCQKKGPPLKVLAAALMLMVMALVTSLMFMGPLASGILAQDEPGSGNSNYPAVNPERTTTGPATGAETTDGSSEPSADIYGEQPEEPDGLKGMVLEWFKSILSFVYDSTIGDLLEKVAEGLQASILGLPAPSGKVVEMYDGMVTAMRPVILVGILITALLMMLRTSSYDVAYASFSALPKFLGVAMAFSFLPQFMQILSRMTLDVSRAFLPSADRGLGAQVELFSAAATNMTGAQFLNIVFAALFVFVGLAVLLVAIVKNVMFQLLFIAGPFALAGSIIPGVQHLAASWFRGVMACAAIPVLWSMEIGVGTVIVSSPEVVFGETTSIFSAWADGMFTMVGAIVILWIMYKTPFKVLEWAFASYDSSRGPIRGFAKTVAAGLAIGGIKKGLGTLAGAATGGGAGAAVGAAATAGGAGTGAVQGTLTGAANRGGLGAGGGMRRITGQSSATGSRGAADLGGSSSEGRELAGSRTPALSEGSSQKALPAASREVEEKFLKKEGTSPGMGKPGIHSPRKRKQE